MSKKSRTDKPKFFGRAETSKVETRKATTFEAETSKAETSKVEGANDLHPPFGKREKGDSASFSIRKAKGADAPHPPLVKGGWGDFSPREPAENPKTGTLHIVATPIGNLADITLRALETLRAADLIAAEDTRHSRKLLSYYDIHKPLVSYHEHNARERGEQLLEKLSQGKNIAVVTDAGTPGISDPGALLIEEALRRGIEPVAVPGPAALVSALVVSGLSTERFVFLGFPPAKGAERRRFFEENAGLPMTLVLYESPKRLIKTLRDALEAWGERKIAVARELTKIHEEVFRGTVSQAVEHFGEEVRGELVLVFDGKKESPETDAEADSDAWKEELQALLARGVSSKEAAAAISERYRLPRRTVYQAALAMRNARERE